MANEPLTPAPEQLPDRAEEIDLLELARKLWRVRKRILKWCIGGALVGLVAAFSIPKEYGVTVKLAPEVADGKQAMGGLSSLAAMAGISLGSSAAGDAVSPTLYPDILESVPFATELFDVEVTDREGKLQTTLYDYLAEHQRRPWWSSILRAPFRALRWVKSLFVEDDPAGPVDPFRLTREQNEVVRDLHDRIACSVDKKTSVITLTVTMQDPLIAATLTDTVMKNLQAYITDYRTNKARHDLEFAQMLHDEAQASYYEAQSRYARYMDANQNMVRLSARTEQERLQNEMTLKFNLYNQMAQQLQLARAKVQESTPAYAVLQPATVPIRATKPSKPLLVIGFAFLAFVAISSWVLFGEELAARFREKEAEETPARQNP